MGLVDMLPLRMQKKNNCASETWHDCDISKPLPKYIRVVGDLNHKSKHT